LLAKAITENKTVRALGGGWSFSKVAAAEGWILNTKMLNMIFRSEALKVYHLTIMALPIIFYLPSVVIRSRN
jgi:hypothetical protein